MVCAVCGATMTGPRHGHYFLCAACGFRASDLAPSLDSVSAHAALDEAARLDGLRQLRVANFERALDTLERLRPPAAPAAPALLDVGSGHGWFLQAAAARGYQVLGLEPDAPVRAHTPPHLRVLGGLFPQAVPAGETFDVISFHDVFEHLPRPAEIVQGCHRLLRPGGLLAISLPSSRGLLFRVALVLAGFGADGALHRFWQRGFPSPHLSYFHPDNLARLLAAHGFDEVARLDLPSVRWRGLWRRVRLDRLTPLPVAAVQWVGLALALPLLRLAPSDNTLQVFRRRPDRRESAP